MVNLEIFQQKLPAHGAAPLLPRGNLFGDERSHSLSLGRRGARCCTVRSPLCAPLFNGGPPLGQVVLWRVASHLMLEDAPGACRLGAGRKERNEHAGREHEEQREPVLEPAHLIY